jgi:hypothetical protein
LQDKIENDQSDSRPTKSDSSGPLLSIGEKVQQGKNKMKVVLHIGMEKTGTTSIQRFLAANSDNLQSLCSTLYVDRILDIHNQRTELVLSCIQQPGKYLEKFRSLRMAEFRPKVRVKIQSIIESAEKSGFTQLLFSSEFMSSRMRKHDEVERLKNLFPPSVDFEIVIYCRRQDELYLGTLSEGIKAGAVHQGLLDRKIELSDGFYSRSYYDYHELLEMWSTIFGKENIKVNVFERSQLKSGDVVSDFVFNTLKIEGLSGWIFPENRRLNRRLSAEFLYYMSIFNQSHDYTDQVELIDNAEKFDSFKSNTFIPVPRLAEFLSSFDSSNNRVAQEYLNQETLFHQNSIASDEYIFADERALQTSKLIIERKVSKELFQD